MAEQPEQTVTTTNNNSVDVFTANDAVSAVFSRNSDLFKRENNSWKFFYKNTENVQDILPLKFGEHEGLLIISDGKVTKWTNYVPEKKVYLKVKDRAGNESDTSLSCATVSLDLKSIKDFIPSGRIVDVDEYGNILYSFDSTNNELFYSGDLIDVETGVYESEVFNGSNDLVSWISITWDCVEPTNTAINLQIRYGDSEDTTLDAEWTDNLIKDDSGYVNIEFIKNQFIQFRAILTSRVRDISPTLSSVTIRNLTSAATHFFTTNFILPNRIISGILTENSVVPVSSDIVFGINTNNSVDFSEYQIIEPNRLFTTNSRQFGSNLRVGVKIISPGIVSKTSADPYNVISHMCIINFDFTNSDTVSKTFQFRVSFYNDVNRTQLAYMFFTGNDQTGWVYTNETVFPATGITIASGSSRSLKFTPGDQVESGNIYYLTIEAFDGSIYETISEHDSYTCSYDSEYVYGEVTVPVLKNFAIVFSMEEGNTVKINM